MKLSEIKPDGRFFGMFVGDSASGKTCAELSFPTPGLMIDIDIRARGGLAATKWLGAEKLDQWDIEFYPPKLGMVDHLIDRLNKLQFEIDGGFCKYKTLLLESSTSLSRMLIEEATNLTDPEAKRKDEQLIKGKKYGRIKIAGPGHFGYEQSGMTDILNFLRSFPINVIMSAHIIPKYGKAPGASEYSDNVVIGEQLALREKVAANIIIYFDEVYRFGRSEDNGGNVKHWVKFRDGELARTTFGNLPNGRVDITDKSFYEFWKRQVASESSTKKETVNAGA